MSMNNADTRPEHSPETLVHTSRNINILGIEEETLVKQANLFKCRKAEKHKGALMISDIKRSFMIPKQ